uniref:4Fe-4S dicluster domain-containing protein n=1 Tax=uncultured Winogradskyella sp. TaxID=395353 RepID=UPI0030EB2ED6
IFLVISFVIANVFLAYLIGGDKLLKYITEGPFEHTGTLIPLLIFTAVFYFVFAWFREQVCIIACPYGRLQGVLLDNKSIVVAYDYKRGEAENGRKKFRKNEDREALGNGDCIDCNQCVNVCPTGIDIRNGTQLECVNCTARMKGYIAVLTILIGILAGMLLLRSDIEARILRLPGQLFEHKDNGIISNVYTFKLVNKTSKDIDDLTFKLRGWDGSIDVVSTSETFKVDAQGIAEGTLFIELKQSDLSGDKNDVMIDLYSNGELIETTSVTFLGPRSFN